MINRLKSIIIDPLNDLHDYSLIESDKTFSDAECGFDLIVLTDISNIDEVLWKNRDFDSIITIFDDINCDTYYNFCSRGFQFRKKWCHFSEFNPKLIANTIISIFFGNVNRSNNGFELFSFFTCTFNTKREDLERLYNSMVNQSYIEWNWFILDDSTDDSVIDTINDFKDYRITVIRNSTNHGSIGFNKHTIGMICDGDYLVEVDHDDELTSDCLYYLKKAFTEYPDTDFAYSDAVEYINMVPCIYGDGWGWGEGTTKTEVVNGSEVRFSSSPEINPFSIRTIYAQPNHVRCWKKSFYHKIGGHNHSFGVLDDMELLIRTFLYGKMTKVDKVLYLQYENGSRGYDGDNAQSRRYGEIQRTCWILKDLYDKKIHERILELGFSDYAWDENSGQSILWKEHTPGLEIMSNLVKP